VIHHSREGSNLADMLVRTGMRYKVMVISARYSGVFIPRLANPDTLVITAADADHPSFGCRDKAKWTYFGNAFFNVALRQAKSLKDAFVLARSLVKKARSARALRAVESPNGRRRKRTAVAHCASLSDRPASQPTPIAKANAAPYVRFAP
jgi:hypothetical protein